LDIENQNIIVKWSYTNAILRQYVNNINCNPCKPCKPENKVQSSLLVCQDMIVDVTEDDVNQAINEHKIIYKCIKDFVEGNKYVKMHDSQ